jgi:hypothetical protein
MPYEPINQVKSHSIIVEDARLGEKTQYKDALAGELALEREAAQARPTTPSLIDRVRRLFKAAPKA